MRKGNLRCCAVLVQSVFNKLFVCVSTYDLFRVSLSSIRVVKWIILQWAIIDSVAIAVFPSYPKSPLSSLSHFGLCGPVSSLNPLIPCKPSGPRILITLFRLVSLQAKIYIYIYIYILCDYTNLTDFLIRIWL